MKDQKEWFRVLIQVASTCTVKLDYPDGLYKKESIKIFLQYYFKIKKTSKYEF